MTMQEEARRIMNQPLVSGRIFEKPKCKPWDIVKGRRFKCCHGLGEHTQSCLGGTRTIFISKFEKITAGELAR